MNLEDFKEINQILGKMEDTPVIADIFYDFIRDNSPEIEEKTKPIRYTIFKEPVYEVKIEEN